MKNLRFAILATAVALGATASLPPEASVPSLVRLQGFLTDSAGQPLEGTFDMTFDLFDAATGGTLLRRAGPMPIQVSKGVYEAGLALSPADFAGADRHLEIMVQGEVLAPRLRIGSVPFAFSADKLDGADAEQLEESEEIQGAVAAHAAQPDAHREHASLEESAEIDADIAAHRAQPDAHREHASLEESAEIDADVAAHAAASDPHPVYLREAGGTMTGTLTLSPSSGNALVTGTGNVGIGTSSPTQKLDVAGSLRVTGSVLIPTTTRYAWVMPVEFDSPSAFQHSDTNLWGNIAGLTYQVYAQVDVPHGARITELLAVFLDNDTAQDMQLTLRRVDAALGSSTSIAQVSSSGASASAQTISTTAISDTSVDTQSKMYSLFLNFVAPSNPSNLRLRGVRVSYTLDHALP